MMTPFRYVDFWDVPRLILFRHREQLVLLASYFDEERDDYDDHYEIILLPGWVEQKMQEGSWAVLEKDAGARRVGRIPVKEVKLDKTRRRKLDPRFMGKYLD